MRSYAVAVIPGDGIGKDVIEAGLRVMQAAQEVHGDVRLEYETFPWSCGYYLEHGRMMPEDGIKTLSGFVFARRGITPEAASSWFLPRVVGISQAMEWVATGRVFDAGEALRGRLVSRVVPDADLLPAAYALAREIADNTSGVAVGAARQLLWSMLGEASPWDAHRAESRALAELATGPDAAEGVAAFLDKRAPEFRAPLGEGPVAGVPRWPAPPDDVVG